MEKKENLEKIPQPDKEVVDLKKESSPEKSFEKKEVSQEKAIEKKDESVAIDDKDVKEEKKEGQELNNERAQEIDDILAKGLNDIFLSLPADKQEEFRKKGEETRDKINQLLDKAKVNIGKIVVLIKKWLSLIPSVNRYFLEQEAKIKADKIIKLKKY